MVSYRLTPYYLLYSYIIIILIILVSRKKSMKCLSAAVLYDYTGKLNGGNGHSYWG